MPLAMSTDGIALAKPGPASVSVIAVGVNALELMAAAARPSAVARENVTVPKSASGSGSQLP